MKNLHLLLTDKPSRLWTNNLLQGKLELSKEVLKGSNTAQHIYITSDEEIKDGYYLDLTHNIVMKSIFYHSSDKNCKKIILTTDQDLIKEGVQDIDDEFLEWFVKNPSCEFVEVDESKYFDGSHGEYIIIIPLEEPKQETLKLKCEKCGCDYEKPSVFKEYLVATKHNMFYKWSLSFCDKCRREKEIESLKALPDILRALEEPKQETLSEASRKYADNNRDFSSFTPIHFENGAKWMAKRSYSEEEVKQMCIDAINSCTNGTSSHCQDFDEFFEQFKKK